MTLTAEIIRELDDLMEAATLSERHDHAEAYRHAAYSALYWRPDGWPRDPLACMTIQRQAAALPSWMRDHVTS